MKFNKIIIISLFMFIMLVSSVSADLNNDIISHYKFDETTGTTAVDSLNNYNMTLINTNIISPLGFINYGLFPNDIYYGTSNIVYDENLTVNLWINVTGTPDNEDYIFNELNAGYFGMIYTSSNGKFLCEFYDTGFKGYSYTIQENNWTMITITMDTSLISFYQNGVLMYNTSFNGLISSATGFKLGAKRDNTRPLNSTYIDELTIWNTKLSSGEISNLYTHFLNGYSYPFNELFTIATNLDDFDIEMVSNETKTYNSSSTRYVTDINTTDTRLWNITISAENYQTQTYTDYNISLNGSITTTMILNSFNITFNASDIMQTGTSIYPFNITLSNSTIYLIENESTVVDISYNLYENITFSKTNWYNLTLYNQTINTNKQINFTNVYDSILNITQIELPYNTSLDNFSGYVYQIDNDYNVSFSTTTNTTTVNLLQGYNYTIYINPTSVYSSFEEDIYINDTTYNLTAEVYKLSSIYISFYDELNLSLMNYTNITLEVISDPYGYETNTLNGTIYLVNLTPNEYILRYSAENYTTRERIVTVIGTDYEVLSLYMISNSSVDHEDITFNVRDYTDNDIENADVKALKYDITTGNYIFIDSCRTNFLGECSMNLEYNSEYYKFQVEYESVIRLTTSPTYITSTSYVLRIDIGDDFTSDYFNYQDIDASLVYNNATNNFRLTYNDNNNLASNFCVYVYSYRYLERTFVGSSCLQTSSGTVLVPITPLNGTYYVAYAYYDDPAIFLISASYEVPISESFSTQGIFLQILLTIMFAVASLKFIEFTGLSVSLSLILGKLMNLNTLGWEAIIGILVASIVIIFVLRRDK